MATITVDNLTFTTAEAKALRDKLDAKLKEPGYGLFVTTAQDIIDYRSGKRKTYRGERLNDLTLTPSMYGPDKQQTSAKVYIGYNGDDWIIAWLPIADA